MNEVLPIILYVLGSILLVVLIVLGVKLIIMMDKLNVIVDNVNTKLNSLNGFFHVIDFTTDKLDQEKVLNLYLDENKMIKNIDCN